MTITLNYSAERPNFTQIPNELLENLDKLRPAETQVLLVICRYTFGYHSDEASIGLTGISKRTGLSRQYVGRILTRLEAANWVVATKRSPAKRRGMTPKEAEQATTYRITLKPLKAGDPVTPELQGVSPRSYTEKKDYLSSKDNKNPIISKKLVSPSATDGGVKTPSRKSKKFDPLKATLPPDVSLNLWSEFVANRKALGKPINKAACSRLIKKLEQAGPKANKLLNKALENSWVGLDVRWLRDDVARAPGAGVADGGDRAGLQHPDWRPVRGQRVEFKEREEEEMLNTKRNELQERARELMQRLAVDNG